MRIAVLANLKANAPTWDGMPADRWDDLDSPKTVEALVAALERGGHEAAFFEASILPPFSLIERLLAYRPDLCFNIAEGHFGDGREAQIPAVLEMLGLPYTGSRLTALALALDKPMTKRILCYHGLPTPAVQVFERADEPVDADLLADTADNAATAATNEELLRFPLFVKPSREGTSMGVSASSIVHTIAELRQQVAFQLDRYRQPILCEQYIQGREITVGMLGNLQPIVARRLTDHTAPNVLPDTLTFLPALEVDLAAYARTEAGLYTNYMKTALADDFRYLCPAPLEPDGLRELHLLAAAVFRVIDCKDVARVDFRLDASDGDKPYILEVNPLPGLNPGYSDLCLQAQAGGWSYERLINAVVDCAAERHNLRPDARFQALA